MRYPVVGSSDASTILHARRSGSTIDAERLVHGRGEGADLPQNFVAALRNDLERVRRRFANGLASPADANRFEAEAAQLVHRRVPSQPDVLADADFWTWLAVIHFSEIIEWRYGNPTGGAKVANYGIGARNENLLFRLWLRADLVLDPEAQDRYHLCNAGQIDFYRSHLIRQGYANARAFARALLRFQYPGKDPAVPKLKIKEVRELVKRLRRLRTNLFLEILDENECRHIIENEATLVAPS